jgi:putative ABC transport system permease protein
VRLTARLARAQLKTAKNRTAATVLGIALSSAMLTTVAGLGFGAKALFDEMLQYDYDNPVRNVALVTVGIIFALIIIGASVIVVSNAFRVSAGERTRQFGMLKSVGATKRQIASSVLYEGVFLSLTGIPAGLALGLLLEYIGVRVVTAALHRMYLSGGFTVDIALPFIMSPLMFIVSAAVAFGTVMLSAWLPARRAAKIPAVEAIFAKTEIRFTKTRERRGKLRHGIFGFEGALAAKSVRRSRRAFRAAVLSLTISIVLIIAAGSFGSMLSATAKLMYGASGATVVASYTRRLDRGLEEGERWSALNSLEYKRAQALTLRFREYPARVYGLGTVFYGSVTVTEDMATPELKKFFKRLLGDYNGEERELPLEVIVADSETYVSLCEKAGVPAGSNILINNLKASLSSGWVGEFAPLRLTSGTLEIYEYTATASESEMSAYTLEIHGALSGADVMKEARLGNNLTVIVPGCTAEHWFWVTDTADNKGFSEYVKSVMRDDTQHTEEGIYRIYSVSDLVQAEAQMRTIYDTIMFFSYSFAGMLALIAVTSVISTISTNVRSRAREFAVLQSVGMTGGGIQKMLNFESVMSAAHALLFGIPLGVLAAYGVWRGMGMVGGIPFSAPWALIGGCILVVFAITRLTMIHAAGRLRRGNIIETIRAADGV